MFRFKKGDYVVLVKDSQKDPGVVEDRYVNGKGLIEYSVVFKSPYKVVYVYEKDLKAHYYDKNYSCQCGAVKVYGADKCSKLHHALWCPARDGIDKEL